MTTRSTRLTGRTPWYAVVAAPLMLTGTQSIVPALPAMQDALSLSEAQIGLFTGAYFLPSILLALPAGMLADRLGRRAVFAGGLILFGTCGLAMTLWHDSFTFLLIARSLQGAAFAAVLPLTITLIADARSGGDQVKGVSHRSIAVKVGEALGPALGGALVLIAWYAPMGLQVLALPLAALSWRQVPRGRTTGSEKSHSIGMLLREFKKLEFVLLQSVGFFRFFFKFTFLTYLPLLTVGSGMFTIFQAGLVLTVSAGAAVAVAAVMTRVRIRRRPSVLIGANLTTVGISLIVIGIANSPWVVIIAGIVFGMADSAVSIIYTAVIAGSVAEDRRATFVATNGAIKNLGKFAAPIGVGLALLVLSISAGFVAVGIAAILVGLSAKLLQNFDPARHPVTP